MTLESLIGLANSRGASDLHLEAGLPAAMRVRGNLQTAGDPLTPKLLEEWARALIVSEDWPLFEQQRSYDFSQAIQGVRCRFNILHSSRGIGFVIRLLTSTQTSIERQNLHPDFKKFVAGHHGLVLVSGATGSGKSTTLAALIEEINDTDSRHIITLESPIEYTFRSRKSFIRQREVGRDTPTFEQGLIDSLREDPDVLMVGEMREPDTMRLTLNASETGHLVFATVHSSTCAEALQRIVSAFPSEIQGSVSAQLADSLVAVICQRLQFREEQKIRVPECEILTVSHAVKNFIRTREFFKISSSIETGAEHGMWTYARYRNWLDKRTKWFIPPATGSPADDTANESRPPAEPAPTETAPAQKGGNFFDGLKAPTTGKATVIEINPDESEFGKILKPPGTKS